GKTFAGGTAGVAAHGAGAAAVRRAPKENHAMNAWTTTLEGFVQLFLAAPAWAVLLTKITAILTAAWLVHLVLLRANPRWRVLLWRLTAVGLIALPPAASLLPAIDIR